MSQCDRGSTDEQRTTEANGIRVKRMSDDAGTSLARRLAAALDRGGMERVREVRQYETGSVAVALHAEKGDSTGTFHPPAGWAVTGVRVTPYGEGSTAVVRMTPEGSA